MARGAEAQGLVYASASAQDFIPASDDFSYRSSGRLVKIPRLLDHLFEGRRCLSFYRQVRTPKLLEHLFEGRRCLSFCHRAKILRLQQCQLLLHFL